MGNISGVTSWRYSEEQLSWERNHYFQAINKRFGTQILELCKDQKLLREKVTGLLEISNLNGTSPELVWITLSNKVNALNLNSCIKLLEEIAINDIDEKLVFRSFYDQKVDWIEDSLERIINSFDEQHKKNMELSCGSIYENEIQKLVLEALNLLNELCPGAYKEAKSILRECVLLSGKGLKSSSVPISFGAVFLLPNKDWNIVNILDFIVHEIAHHSLVIKSSLVKIINNPTDLSKSPLRPDPRPINGILHATFVLVRVCYILIQYIQQDGEYSKTAIKYVSNYLKNLNEGLNSLKLDANWTSEGVILMEDMMDGYIELKVEFEKLGVLK
ncbi:aKG-HExxH-type peptide beta-hydroxylase [Lysinibacillus xylanilyticus]|uniref:aKG-HExxH-type peptide beta-hydroxylase n=1 Tax=Lysinibacillus xylanilyticus TaxID=582475 RepID=UPI0012FDCB64|nr:HEXXH motif-containing putative peptide modification protein [Lysinibacillus xylanilyticus]